MPKPRITREMIIDAAFEIARAEGVNSINARTVSQRLGCSTQPVLYYFKRIEDIKRAVYEKADGYHTRYITDTHGDNPMLEIGILFIRFAQTEKHLFHLLFQSNEFEGRSVAELAGSGDIAPVITVLSEAAGLDSDRAAEVFRILFLFVHGYASMFANNDLEYDENVIAEDLRRAFAGAVYAAGEELK